ncbi:conserved fungal protein [Diplocarpon rosae]|nr:conserved fungal protein [Diplocarpon rosae]
MNNDSAANDLPSSETQTPAQTPVVSERTTATAGDDVPEPVLTTNDAQSPAQKSAHAQIKKKQEFITSLMLNLDILIYVELSILYYMDCSLFRLLLRSVNQMMFLTPKPTFIPPAPQHGPYIGAIFLPNIICILLHLFTARPEAGEAMRGYLHGGIIIDLIGYKGPTSKFHLLLLDLLVLVLQCFMLAVHVEKGRLSTIKDAFKTSSVTPVTMVQGEAVAVTQDLDAEERGERNDDIVTSNSDMEMQVMMPQSDGSSSRNEEGDGDSERERLRAESPPPQEEELDTTLEILWSGTAIVNDFHILHNLRRQWQNYGSATESALQTVGFSAEFAAVTASRRMNGASARFQRDVEPLET